MDDTRWSDRILDPLRTEGDKEAEECLSQVGGEAADSFREINRAFRAIRTNRDALPADAPQALRDFWERRPTLDLDRERLQRGQNAFLEHGVLCVISLLNKSLLEGYSAPALTQVLSVSGDLEKRTFRRLMGVLQMVLDVVADDGFGPEGRAVVLGAELRLLHEGVRRIVARDRPDYQDLHGLPVNHEDMLATLMGFSLLPIEGLRAFSADSTEEEEEDIYYVWRVFGECMGIPREILPVDVADARAFYSAYARRHFSDADVNAEGVALAAADLRLLESVVPAWAVPLGLRALPRILCRRLMTPAAMARVQVPPVSGHWFWKGVVHAFISIREGATRFRPVDRVFHKLEKLACWVVLRGLVRLEYNGVPAVIVPGTAKDLWRL